MQKKTAIEKLLGAIPNRLQLAGGWIDQPFVSRHNPEPPGAMVVVQIEPDFRPMDRSGIASGTRAVAMKLWRGKLPERPREELVQELYEAENKGKAEPSGSQDMIGLIYPGINRLDYDYEVHGGVFPTHIESCNHPEDGALVEPRFAPYSRLSRARKVTAHWASRIWSRSGSPDWGGRARTATRP